MVEVALDELELVAPLEFPCSVLELDPDLPEVDDDGEDGDASSLSNLKSR